MKKILIIIALIQFCVSENFLSAQSCLPVSAVSITYTTAGIENVETASNVPTGGIIALISPATNTVFNINMCANNVGTPPFPSGVNDTRCTILSANAPNATVLAEGDDGCTDVASPGYGPTLMTFVAPQVGTYYLYITEWDGNNGCVADGINNYDVEITTTLADSVDATILNVTGLEYSKIPLSQLNINGSFALNVLINNFGFNNTSYTLNAQLYNLTSTPNIIQQVNNSSTVIGSFDTISAALPVFNFPDTIGNYAIRVIVNAIGDNNSTNDTSVIYFSITDKLFARDNEENEFPFSAEQPIRLELVQSYEFNTSVAVNKLIAKIDNSNSEDFDSLRIIVLNYDLIDGSPTTYILKTPFKGTKSLPFGINEFDFSPPLNLEVGKYFFGIEAKDALGFVGLFTSSGNITENMGYYTAAGSSWTSITDPNAGFFVAFYVRLEVEENTSTNITEVNSNNRINIYPNPVNNTLTIMNEKDFFNTPVQVLSLDGKILYSDFATGNTTKINMSDYKSGVYIVKVLNADNVFNVKVVVTH